MAVARQELPYTQRAGAMRRADHDDVAEAAGDQLDAAEENARIRISLSSASVWMSQAAARDRAR
jgi:hypothetical protein